ncbi:MAG: hypothetical protein COV29_02765 [Candidatus Yanofskybacteria bacterium CG10_big_fil_rev_8_21_14_0_10_36_16]|uniref:Lipoprotein n=1 Tax=Candidatus Yanofskybacteria bacterium CG10_big_fil_rev_8_21_14_0_10_36_16 TaxID=1975096 RepID=A0A2J0Q7W6_9BACT|nr:MAG: hypothetical protein COV29_02765 [Candidatus Yanofskybacteria bacterium CG10_big_fil_rev_8_21_14_0_10_36_16]
MKPALSVVLFLILLGAGCHNKPRVYTPPAPTKTEKEEPKPTKQENNDNAVGAIQKNKTPGNSSLNDDVIIEESKKRIKYAEKLMMKAGAISDRISGFKDQINQKSDDGFDMVQSNKALQELGNLLNLAVSSIVSALTIQDLDQPKAILDQIDTKLKTEVESLIKKASKFEIKDNSDKDGGEKFNDDRDFVRENLGYPSSPSLIQTGPLFFKTRILGYLPPIECRDGMGNYSLDFPPQVKIWRVCLDGGDCYDVVFIENVLGIDRFIMSQTLDDNTRNLALDTLCKTQGSGYENYKLISAYRVGTTPIGTPEQYLEQLITGRFRFADQFGLAALEGQKAAAALEDLEIKSLVFNTTLENVLQIKNTALNEIIDIIFGKEVNGTRIGGLIENYNENKKEEIIKRFLKIQSWEVTFLPDKDHKKRLLIMLDDPDSSTLSQTIDSYEKSIVALKVELEGVKKNLLRFERDYNDQNNELIFYDDDPVLIIAVLLKDVGFKFETVKGFIKKETPDLDVYYKLYWSQTKYAEPILAMDDFVKIKDVNNYAKDFSRLTSFMIKVPFKPDPQKGGIRHLSKGEYRLELRVRDNVRRKSSVNNPIIEFTVLPASERKK